MNCRYYNFRRHSIFTYYTLTYRDTSAFWFFIFGRRTLLIKSWALRKNIWERCHKRVGWNLNYWWRFTELVEEIHKKERFISGSINYVRFIVITCYRFQPDVKEWILSLFFTRHSENIEYLSFLIGSRKSISRIRSKGKLSHTSTALALALASM